MARDPAAPFLGIISGTSADAIDVALVRFDPTPRLVAAHAFPFDPALRARVLALSQAATEARAPLDEIAALDVALGQAFAAAALALLERAGVAPGDVGAIGSHGQTLRHRPSGPQPFTWQLGDPHVIAERCGIATVADFRRRDVAAGGQGAPLMPAFHAAAFAAAGEARAVLNLGGIANLTLMRDDAPVVGFDTGPANALLDAWSLRERGAARDDGGEWARGGQVDATLLARLMADPYFRLPPPKSTGRDAFHLDWVRAALAALGPLAAQDVQATLAELSAATIAEALRGAMPGAARVIACGGGVHNEFLMQRLAARLGPVRLESSAAHGVDPDFVEAMGFAWLARETLAGRPGNLPSVTGAAGPRILGAIHPA